MRPTTAILDRLSVKSDAHTLSHLLTTRYDLSLAEAECLTQELRQKQDREDPLFLQDGQIFYTAIDILEPAGKPLKHCRTRRIRLTLHSPEDLAFRAEHGLRAYQKLLVSRLCFEAFHQNALLAQEDLCRLLYISRATVQRLLREYRQQDDYIPTRGNYHDIGPALSHKYQAIRLYLRGCQPSQIAQRLCHNLSSIERYLNAFCRIMAALDAGFTLAAIQRFSGLSPRLIQDYQTLYQQFREDPACQIRLESLRQRQNRLWQAQKGGL
jgi:DNA-binding NarL/FixJ family response regulator